MSRNAAAGLCSMGKALAMTRGQTEEEFFLRVCLLLLLSNRQAVRNH